MATRRTTELRPPTVTHRAMTAATSRADLTRFQKSQPMVLVIKKKKINKNDNARSGG